MRRENRMRRNTGNTKNILYIGGSILAIGVIAFAITFILYGNKMEEQSNIGASEIAKLASQSTTNTEMASTAMGKTVEESKNQIQTNTIKKEVNTNTVTNTTNTTNTISNAITNKDTKNNNTIKNEIVADTNKKETTNTVNTNQKGTVNTASTNTSKKETSNKELEFVKPVDGEISKEFAKEKLIYSQTLQEWTTHLGIDIKAEKTSIVKAAEAGKVKSIKNDPRYGLSIIIEHQNGFETLYSNLLTSEFVQVGEEVKKGQSVGTVGNTATFEIADDAHLHFEITKNGQSIDPSQYIK